MMLNKLVLALVGILALVGSTLAVSDQDKEDADLRKMIEKHAKQDRHQKIYHESVNVDDVRRRMAERSVILTKKESPHQDDVKAQEELQRKRELRKQQRSARGAERKATTDIKSAEMYM